MSVCWSCGWPYSGSLSAGAVYKLPRRQIVPGRRPRKLRCAAAESSERQGQQQNVRCHQPALQSHQGHQALMEVAPHPLGRQALMQGAPWPRISSCLPGCVLAAQQPPGLGVTYFVILLHDSTGEARLSKKMGLCARYRVIDGVCPNEVPAKIVAHWNSGRMSLERNRALQGAFRTCPGTASAFTCR